MYKAHFTFSLFKKKKKKKKKNTGMFQPMFGSNMDKPNHWFKIA